MYGSFSNLGAVHGVSSPILSHANGPLSGEVYSSSGLTTQQLRQTSTLGTLGLAGVMPGSRPAWELVAARPSALSAALAGTTTEQQHEESDSDAPGSGRHGRKPQMQGRFSGRLALKEDERRLAEECRLLGPLLGGVGKRTDKSRLTLAKIVRGIACGAVRRHCEEREAQLQALRSRVIELESILPGVERLQEQMLMMRAELDIKDKRLAELEPDLQGLSRAVRVAQQHELIRRTSQPEGPGMVASLPPAGLQPTITSAGGGLAQRFSVPLSQQPSQQQSQQAGQQQQSGQFASIPSNNGGNAMSMQAAALANAMMVKRRSSSGVGSGHGAVLPPSATQDLVAEGMFGAGTHGVTGVTGVPGVTSTTPALPHPFMTGCPPGLDHQVRVSATGSGLGPVPSNLTAQQQQSHQQGSTRPPLASSRSLERAYGGNLNGTAQPGTLPSAGGSLPQNNSLTLGNGALPLQSPFCINIPSGTSNAANGGSIFNMAALLAQHNAQQQQQQQQVQQQQQQQVQQQQQQQQLSQAINSIQQTGSSYMGQQAGQAGAPSGNGGGMPNSASVGSGLYRAASAALNASSEQGRNLPLPFPDMTRQASTNAETLGGGGVPGFGAIKMGSLGSQHAANGDSAGRGTLGLPSLAGFAPSRRPSDPSGNMPTSEVIRRLSTADNVSNPGSGNATATGAVLYLTDADTATITGAGPGRVTADGTSTLAGSGASGLQVKESPDSRHSSQGGAPSMSPPLRGRANGKRNTGEDVNGGVQGSGGSCKRPRSAGGRRDRSGNGGNGGNAYLASSPRGTVDALHLLTDAAMIESGEGERQAQGQAGEVFGQHVPPLGHPMPGSGDTGGRIPSGTGGPGQMSNRSSPHSVAQMQQGQMSGALVSPEVQTLARDMSAPAGLTQMQVAARQQQLTEQLTDQLADQVQQGGIGNGSGGGSNAGELMPSPSPIWGGHYSLAAQQQQMQEMQGQLLPLRSMSSGGPAPNLSSLTSAPSWLQQLQQHMAGAGVNANLSAGAQLPASAPAVPNPAPQYLAAPGMHAEQDQQLEALQAQQQQAQQQQQAHLDSLHAQQQAAQQQQMEAMHQQQMDSMHAQQQQQQLMHQAQQMQQMQAVQQHQQHLQQMQAAQQQQLQMQHVQQARHSNLGSSMGTTETTWSHQPQPQMQPQGPSITTAMPTGTSPFGSSMQQQFNGLQSLEHVTLTAPLTDTLVQQQSQQGGDGRQEEHVAVPLALCRGMSTEGLAFNPSQGLYNIHNLEPTSQQQTLAEHQQQQQQQMSMFADVQQLSKQASAPLQRFADAMGHSASYIQQQSYGSDQQQQPPQSQPSEQLLAMPAGAPGQMMFYMASN